ncbi:MAG: hypothetical protein ACRD0P_03970 [Stackebrandtia sp.]
MDLPDRLPSAIIPVLGALAAIGVAAWVLAVVLRRRRIARLKRWGAEHGFTYYEWDDRLTWLSSAYPFNARREYGHHVFHGRRHGRYIIFGEHHGHEGRQGRKHQLVAVQLPAECPFLDISQETVGSRMAAVFGVRDLQLESQAFNDHFKIDTATDRFAYDILTPRVMSWLLDDERGRVLPWRIEDDWLLTWRYGRFDESDALLYLRFLFDLFDRVPDYLWRDG